MTDTEYSSRENMFETLYNQASEAARSVEEGNGNNQVEQVKLTPYHENILLESKDKGKVAPARSSLLDEVKRSYNALRDKIGEFNDTEYISIGPFSPKADLIKDNLPNKMYGRRIGNIRCGPSFGNSGTILFCKYNCNYK